jgi:pyruvate/2-oxoglutarate dehydrogenase complex dihydrolipoamide acyltransferase (E2) component
MSQKSPIVFVAAAVSIAALLAGYFGLRSRSPAPLRSAPRAAAAPASAPAPSFPAATAPPTRAATPLVSAAPAASASAGVAALDEPQLMAKLRQLRSSDPNLSLQLARQGNERFKHSPDAAERAWFVVKSLSDLGRHDEARVEGRALLDAHRGSRWAEDVYRHLFVNPPTHPFERGYGKDLE